MASKRELRIESKKRKIKAFLDLIKRDDNQPVSGYRECINER